MTRPSVRSLIRFLIVPLAFAAVVAAAQPRELWYGVYLGNLNVGTMTFRQQISVTGETFVASARMELGPNRLNSELTLELDRAGDVQHYASSSDERDEAGESSTRYTIERVGGGYRFERIDKDASGTSRDSGGLSIERGAVAEPLLPVRVAEVDWPRSAGVVRIPVFDADGDDFWTAEARYAGEVEVEVRGFRRLAQAVDVQTDSGGDTQRMFVLDGTVVAIHMDEAITAVLGTESEAHQDLAGAMDPDERVLREKVRDIIIGFASGDPDIIIPHLNMAALQCRWGEENPSVMDLREAAFVRYFAEGIRQQADQTNETAMLYADVISAAVAVHVDGGQARLDFPGAGADEALQFQLDPDGVWRLHWWSAFARNRS